MSDFYAVPVQDTLVSVDGRIDLVQIENLTIRDHTSIKSLLGDVNEIWLGKPNVYKLNEEKQKLIHPNRDNLLEETDEFELIVVQLAASFRPASQCEFVRGSLKITLETSSGYATIRDLFPKNIGIKSSYKRAFSVSPNLTMAFNTFAQIDTSGISVSNSEEYIKYEPELTAFGSGESSGGWDFNKTKMRSISGIKELFILLEKPKAVPLQARFELSAWVQTNIQLGITIPLSTFVLSGSDKPLAKESLTIV